MMVPMASHMASSVRIVRLMAMRAMTRPVSAPKSSRRTTGSSGCLARRMNCHHERSPLRGRDSMTAVRNDQPSRTMAITRMAMATDGDSSSWGWRSFSMPSKMAKREPRLKSTRATTKAQK